MSLYHLHARLLEGPLDASTRNELLSEETDDWCEVLALADELAARGFAVWVYDHGRRSPFPTASDFRVVAEFAAFGARWK